MNASVEWGRGSESSPSAPADPRPRCPAPDDREEALHGRPWVRLHPVPGRIEATARPEILEQHLVPSLQLEGHRLEFGKADDVVGAGYANLKGAARRAQSCQRLEEAVVRTRQAAHHRRASHRDSTAASRWDRAATIIFTQIPVAKWFDIIGDPTLADAICDRIVPQVMRINLTGKSMRAIKKVFPTPES